ncbi:unnamed protein product [Darwinula stevensoni]|uniref:Uncharacterized protein n=1 Tax=Darwinula stevensoni TaxID=69355 RepID=A0A7R9AF78_9CRUS|nr:unnamed protein product [Darwinula stevensoni]CAG0902722.1 unnamed protein product [Darwinula stevensoni]
MNPNAFTSANCGAIEHLWCVIGGATGKIVIGISYRPPNSSLEDEAAYFALMRRIGEISKQNLHWYPVVNRLQRSNYAHHKVVALENDDWVAMVVDGMDQKKTNVPRFAQEDKHTNSLQNLVTHIEAHHRFHGSRRLGICAGTNDLHPGMLAVVYTEEKTSRPWVGNITSIEEKEATIHWYKGTYEKSWNPMIGIESLSTVPRESLLSWEFNLTDKRQLLRIETREELKRLHQETDQIILRELHQCHPVSA